MPRSFSGRMATTQMSPELQEANNNITAIFFCRISIFCGRSSSNRGRFDFLPFD
jgi:hypothetical protein